MPAEGVESIRVNSRSSSVVVICEDRSDIRVTAGANERDLRREGAQVTIEPGHGLEVRCPAGIGLFIGTMSGRVEVRGRAGDTRANTASGKIEIDECGRADLRSLSGAIEVGRAGPLRAASKSGRIAIGAAERIDAATVSGSITVGVLEGEGRVKTVSGKVAIGSAGRSDVDVHTISGPVRVLLPPGVRPQARLKSISGRPRCDCPPGDDLCVAVSTLTGKIEVVSS